MWVILFTPELIGALFIVICMVFLGLFSGFFGAINSCLNGAVYGFGSLIGILIAITYVVFLLSPALAFYFVIKAVRTSNRRAMSVLAALFFALATAIMINTVHNCLKAHDENLAAKRQVMEQDSRIVRLVDYNGPSIFMRNEDDEYSDICKRLDIDLPFIAAGETYTLPCFDNWSVKVYSTREYYLFQKHSRRGVVEVPFAGHRGGLLAGGSADRTFVVPEGDLCVTISRK